jgi:hypothetical protein
MSVYLDFFIVKTPCFSIIESSTFEWFGFGGITNNGLTYLDTFQTTTNASYLGYPQKFIDN